jgi:hypothetical protein
VFGRNEVDLAGAEFADGDVDFAQEKGVLVGGVADRGGHGDRDGGWRVCRREGGLMVERFEKVEDGGVGDGEAWRGGDGGDGRGRRDPFANSHPGPTTKNAGLCAEVAKLSAGAVPQGTLPGDAVPGHASRHNEALSGACALRFVQRGGGAPRILQKDQSAGVATVVDYNIQAERWGGGASGSGVREAGG